MEKINPAMLRTEDLLKIQGHCQTIWKFPLKVEDEQTIHPPKDWEFLCIQVVFDIPCIYMLVDPSRPKDSVKIITKGTGHDISESELGEYIGTYQLENGMLVFHVFRIGASRKVA